MPKDLLGRELNIGDLVAWGHSGRYAGTRIGRVYHTEGGVRVWILEQKRNAEYRRTQEWIKGHHAKPLDPIKLDDSDLPHVPKLDQL